MGRGTAASQGTFAGSCPHYLQQARQKLLPNFGSDALCLLLISYRTLNFHLVITTQFSSLSSSYGAVPIPRKVNHGWCACIFPHYLRYATQKHSKVNKHLRFFFLHLNKIKYNNLRVIAGPRRHHPSQVTSNCFLIPLPTRTTGPAGRTQRSPIVQFIQ